jgi:hypothetical protein
MPMVRIGARRDRRDTRAVTTTLTAAPTPNAVLSTPGPESPRSSSCGGDHDDQQVETADQHVLSALDDQQSGERPPCAERRELLPRTGQQTTTSAPSTWNAGGTIVQWRSAIVHARNAATAHPVITAGASPISSSPVASRGAASTLTLSQ